jgi:two-component system sensor histidine kinase/response regulator
METDIYRILAVDDNPRNMKVLATLLPAHLYHLDYALSGQEALNRLSEDSYDLILLDVMMPGMDGFETCQRIKREGKNRETPVIFLTARTDIESLKRGFQCGGVDFLTKPFNIEELIARVRTHIDLKRTKEELRDLNHTLEQKVMDRTAELREAYGKLERAIGELQTLDHAKTEFLRMINHEIRTPLNAILGFTDVLKKELRSTPEYELIGYIDLASSRLEKFLMVILQITELLTREKPIHKEMIQVREMINSAIRRHDDMITGSRVRLSIRETPAGLRVPGDRQLVRICIDSILENAVKYSLENGRIWISMFVSGDKVQIEVKDEGKGFSEEAQKNLFKFFAVGEQHIDENVGLDLALAKLIVEAHKGEILVQNNDDRGATVTLIFPQTIEVPVQEPASTLPSSLTKKIHERNKSMYERIDKTPAGIKQKATETQNTPVNIPAESKQENK